MGFGDERVAVIGGGISGITCALILQLSGHQVDLYAKSTPRSFSRAGPRPAPFASLHAAASILPHSIESALSTRWTLSSQRFFAELYFAACCGVRRQKHYEVFERESVSTPSYAGALDKFQQLDERDFAHEWVPQREGATHLSGWQFEVFFCEAPYYLAYLYGFFEAIGGSIVNDSARPPTDGLADYLRLDHTFYVNCTGHDAVEFANHGAAVVEDRPDESFFEPLQDRSGKLFLRGHYVKVRVDGPARDSRGDFFSYNYTPDREVYTPPNGGFADVYCYPRADAWLLGGSRQVASSPDDLEGPICKQGEIEFPDATGNFVTIPKPVFALNAELIERITGKQVRLVTQRNERPDTFEGGVGFRFQRENGDSNVRLAPSRVFLGREKYVLHNYGHGGSGFALSWGCAVDILSLLTQISGGPRPTRRLSGDDLGINYSATHSLLVKLLDRL